tara:strand:- start:1018 stop:1872 length:855 start_codon:yes stop_codon:yes gene_type:complete
MLKYYQRYKNTILNLSLKKIYSHFFLRDIKPTGYYSYLKDLVFKFLQSKYPNYNQSVFNKNFDNLLSDLGDYKNLSLHTNDLFDPNFHNNLEFHYKYYEKNIFFKLISYSINTKLIQNNYSNVYDFAINEIKEPLDILEIGGGLPHGFIYHFWKSGNNFFKNFTYIDAPLLHSDFIKWYFNHFNILNTMNLFKPAKTPKLDKIKFNFVFAKDIFEHLDNPEIIIDYLISNTNDNKTLLCLDLEQKNATNQHISPDLPILKDKLIKNNFKVIKKFNDVHVWRKVN